jgi:hypothetical protein
MSVTWSGNNIFIAGSLSLADIGDFARAANVVCAKQGYRDVTLNFAQAAPVRESFMVPAIALIRDLRRERFSFELMQPENLGAKTSSTTLTGRT